MKSPAFEASRRLRPVAAVLALLLCAMPVGAAEPPARSFADMIKRLPLVPAGPYDSEMLAKVSSAVDFIQRMELSQAQHAANEALQLDPRSAHLHFLNGFIYHLQARQGDTQKAELALEGYQQALRIDPSHWIAQEFRGLAHMDLKQFDPARLAFSEALLLNPESPVSVFGLMVAAYLAGDAPTACAMADQFRKAQADMPHDFVRSSLAVYASCGRFGQADDMRALLARQGSNAVELQRLDQRLVQWKAVYSRQQAAAAAIKTSLVAAPQRDSPVQLAQAFSVPKAADPQPKRAAAPEPAAAAPALAANTDMSEGGPRMLLVDVVLLSTQEMASTSKGINLLNALTLQLGSVAGNLAAFSRVFTGNAQGSSTAITRAVTVPALSYSLNIANANNAVNEVLARPTLAAIEGLPSEFLLGKLSVKMVATVAIDKGQQLVNLTGNLDGQKISVSLNGSTMGVEVSASCINPFEIKASLTIKADTDIADVFAGQAGANVDPSKIGGCIGKELEAAYNKIAGAYSQLSGYSAKLANEELTKLANSAADEARKDFNKTKDAARDVASKSTSVATKAFNDAGNAFKKLGKKRKHRKGPDPKFAGSVFDWDYYYDNHADMQKPGVDLTAHWKNSGFAEGRRGSLEFSASYYLNRYADVASACPGNNLPCALQHWLDFGIEMGRQGSPDFNVVSYMNRYGDVPRTLAPEDDPDALEHWLTSGFDAGRDGRPASTATGPFSPPTRAGGGGGGPWNDAAQCQNLHVIGFRVSSGDRVDGVQFLYSNNQWGAVHGSMKNDSANVTLPAGQFIERINYRSGASMDAVGFLVNTGMPATKAKKSKFGVPVPSMPEIAGPDPSIHYEAYGMYGGGGGTYATYTVTPGERLACMTGRSGQEVDQLIFSSTGQR